jgi:very-short-patch-repair endonuclease
MNSQIPTEEHGTPLPYDRKLKQRSRDLRNNATLAEQKLWNVFLRRHRLRFTRQKPILHYIVDFYCSKAKLVIEIDGESHSADDAKLYDEGRTLALEEHGLYVLRFRNADVMENIAGVCRCIENELKKRDL